MLIQINKNQTAYCKGLTLYRYGYMTIDGYAYSYLTQFTKKIIPTYLNCMWVPSRKQLILGPNDEIGVKWQSCPGRGRARVSMKRVFKQIGIQWPHVILSYENKLPLIYNIRQEGEWSELYIMLGDTFDLYNANNEGDN